MSGSMWHAVLHRLPGLLHCMKHTPHLPIDDALLPCCTVQINEQSHSGVGGSQLVASLRTSGVSLRAGNTARLYIIGQCWLRLEVKCLVLHTHWSILITYVKCFYLTLYITQSRLCVDWGVITTTLVTWLIHVEHACRDDYFLLLCLDVQQHRHNSAGCSSSDNTTFWYLWWWAQINIISVYDIIVYYSTFPVTFLSYLKA